MFIGVTPTILRPLSIVASFTPVTVERSGATSAGIMVPEGATKALIECIGTGGSSVNNSGGSGACYSKTNSVNLPGISVLFVEIATGSDGNGYFPSQVKAVNSSGTILCSATSGKPGLGAVVNNGVGDIKYNGGKGSGTPSTGAGGGAAGRGGNGTDATVDARGNITPGTGSSPGGNGSSNQKGKPYGGGGGSQVASYDDDGNPTSYSKGEGGDGWVSITFS